MRRVGEVSGDRRGAVLDGSQCGMIKNRGQEMARSCHAQNAEGHFRDGRQRKTGDRWKNGMGGRTPMASAQQGVGLGWVLDCLQVICNRNHREQDQQEHRQGRKLRSPVHANARGRSQPEAKQKGGQQNPGEIEDQLHSQS